MANWRNRIAAVITTGNDTDYRRGPGRAICTTAPVIAAYVNGALHRPCPNCHAGEHQLCTHPDGTPRKAPCPRRLTETRP